MSDARCLFCDQPIRTITLYGRGGTVWIHDDGYRECLPHYAAPNFHNTKEQSK